MVSNREVFYKFFSWLYVWLKKLRARDIKRRSFEFFDIQPQDVQFGGKVLLQKVDGSDESIDLIPLSLKEFDPVENVCAPGINRHLRRSFLRGERGFVSFDAKPNTVAKLWLGFIERSIIPEGFARGGLHYGGYIGGPVGSWCLPSWIWTNAAIIRMYCSLGDIQKAKTLADILLSMQHYSGGWVVRNDYQNGGARPILAPNDSAYIANNAFIEIYLSTSENMYLEAAKKCADWIIKTARPDGLVWTGWDVKSSSWLTDRTIVDTGFTACLFARLLHITGNDYYRKYLIQFTTSFIKSFYVRGRGFATCIDEEGRKRGGRFIRGQAWALEGLISAHDVLKCSSLRAIVDDVVAVILQAQLKNGGWPYNLSRPYLGEDCKGIPVLAKTLLEWRQVTQDRRLIIAAQKAIDWCISHTHSSGDASGGIFSFSMEGAIVHNFNTETALVYGSAYALEAHNAIRNEDNCSHK